MRWRDSYLRVLASALIPATAGSVVRAVEPQVAEALFHVQAAAPEPYTIPRNLTGKFCEHLGANIYNGMDAQVLRNATFAEYPFWTGHMTPDGIATFHFERDKIEGELRRQAANCGWPDSELSDLLVARSDGLACFWSRAGQREAIVVGPDTGPGGGRAQRLELKAGGGIKQWTWLPLHRTHRFEFELLARSPELTSLQLTILRQGSAEACGFAAIERLSDEWRTMTGTLTLSTDSAADEPYCVALTSVSPGQLVIGHLFLRPTDHIHGADPDVIRLLKEARLPLLRWPGGNFVSAYHWEDGIGLIDTRPTRPNYAWGGVEPNTFGTDEFIGFCRAVGCEPMVCVNAGTGTPDEAARWVEYCNGPVSSPMGARRAANGHAEPFNVRHWEVGNELWGHWQAHWTTASGYVDRYQRFSRALLKADPTIELHACGAPVLWGKSWNDTLISTSAARFHSITDHPLVGGDVPRSTDPMDVFRDFMYVPDVLERKWGELRDEMLSHDLREPRLAVTELQMFAHLGPALAPNQTERLNHQNLVNPGTLAEALYDTLIYHSAVRLQPFVQMVTHSATVNHGGGLRKEHERVYANPCYYANLLFSDFAGAKPVKTELTAPSEHAPRVLPDIKNTSGEASFGVVDGLAALGPKGELLLSFVHRGASGPVRLHVRVDDFPQGRKVQIHTLSGTTPWAGNTLENPKAVEPIRTGAELREGSMTLVLPPFSVVQARIDSEH